MALNKLEGVFTMQCLSYALVLCKSLESNMPTLHWPHNAPRCPWTQLMLQKITKLAEIFCLFFTREAICQWHIGYIYLWHNYNIRKESIAQYSMILCYTRQGFCSYALLCTFLSEAVGIRWQALSGGTKAAHPIAEIHSASYITEAPSFSWEEFWENRVKGLVFLSLLPSYSSHVM